jgi:hypothetical protein
MISLVREERADRSAIADASARSVRGVFMGGPSSILANMSFIPASREFEQHFRHQVREPSRFKLGQKARNYRTTETAKKGKTPGHGFGHRGFLVQRQSGVWRIVIAPKSSTVKSSTVPVISATV